MTDKTFYFAYGSNLKLQQMRERCPGSQYIGVALLSDWQWIINGRGVVNIIPSRGDVVYGFLFTLTPDDERKLDKNEGPNYAKRYKTLDFGNHEHAVSALIYIDLINTTPGRPREEYIPRMRDAIKDALEKGILRSYIDKYLRPSIPAISGD